MDAIAIFLFFWNAYLIHYQSENFLSSSMIMYVLPIILPTEPRILTTSEHIVQSLVNT